MGNQFPGLAKYGKAIDFSFPSLLFHEPNGSNKHEALVKGRDSLRQFHQALLQRGAAEAFNHPPDYGRAKLDLDQPGFGLGLADQFTGPAFDTLMPNKPADDLLNEFVPGQSFLDMNHLDTPNMGTFIDPFEMNHSGVDMDDPMAMNPLKMINNDDDHDANLHDQLGPFLEVHVKYHM